MYLLRYGSFYLHCIDGSLTTFVQIGRITCDNATNNDAMMVEFASRLETRTTMPYGARANRVQYAMCLLSIAVCHNTLLCSCLAHIINLMTQALLTNFSRSLHYDPQHPDRHLPPDVGPDSLAVPNSRDVVGLVRMITVKVRQFYCC